MATVVTTLHFRALHVSMLYGGPAHIKLVAEWDPEVKARVFGVVADEVPEPHQSVVELQRIYKQPLTATLDDCLKIYTKEETVGVVEMCSCVVNVVLISSLTVRTLGFVLIANISNKMQPKRLRYGPYLMYWSCT